MNCRNIRRDLIPFIEGALPSHEAQRVQAHMDQCSSCTNEKSSLGSVVGLLAPQRLAGAELDENAFIAKVHEKAESQGAKPRPRWARAAIAFAVCLLIAGAAVGVVALYRSMEPVTEVGGAGAFDEQSVMGPTVIWNPDLQLYQMWYDGRDTAQGAAIGYATSRDGEIWAKHEASPVIPADARWPSVIYEPDDTDAPYKIWFNVGPGESISYARSLDGIQWTDIQTVLERGPAGSYDDTNVAAPCVLKVGDEYWMYYDAGTSAIQPPYNWGHYIALATSSDGVNWTKRQTVLGLGLPAYWDGARVYNAQVIYTDGLFEMWHTGAAGTGGKGAPRNIGYARSTDGLNWTKSPRNPVVWGTQAPEAYDASVGPPAVLKVEHGYKVWFTAIPGDATNHWQIGYAEYPLDAWDFAEGEPGPGPMFPAYTSAEAFALSDQERMELLIPRPDETSLPEYIFLDDVPFLCEAYSLPQDDSWTWIRAATQSWKSLDEANQAHMWRRFERATRPAPGLAILFRRKPGDNNPTYIFGTVAVTVEMPPNLGGGTKTFTVHDDAYRVVYTRYPPDTRFELLHLNPNADQP